MVLLYYVFVDLMRLLFEGGFYSRADSIQGRILFKGGFYSRAASIQGRRLFKVGFYSRTASIYFLCRFDAGYISFYDAVALQMRRIVEFRVYL